MPRPGRRDPLPSSLLPTSPLLGFQQHLRTSRTSPLLAAGERSPVKDRFLRGHTPPIAHRSRPRGRRSRSPYSPPPPPNPPARGGRPIPREGPILTRSYTAHRPSISNTRSSIEIALLSLDSSPRDEDHLLDLGPRGGLVRVRGRAYEDTDAFMNSPAGRHGARGRGPR